MIERRMKSNMTLTGGFRLRDRKGRRQIFIFFILFKDRFVKLILILLVLDFLIGIVEYDMELQRERNQYKICMGATS
jgi:hypothetical protein